MIDIDALFHEARQHQHRGDLSDALALYERILQHQPNHADAWHGQGLIYAQQGQMPEAIRCLEQAMRLAPDNPAVHNNLGNAWKNTGQIEQAIAQYQQAIALAPDYAQAHNNLAGIYARQGLYQAALRHYHLAVHAEPDFSAAHFNLGLLLLNHHQLRHAETQFRNVLSLNPEHLDAQFYLGVLALEEERLNEAEACFSKVIQHDPNHVQALCNLGIVTLKRQQGQLAIDYFSKALALDNDHSESRNNLAATFMHYDRFENALMHYDVLLQQDPDNIDYLYNSGVAEMALGHLNEATGHFEHLLSLQGDHFSALNNLAAIFIRLENRGKARELLKKAVAANPADTASQHMLRALSGKTDKAETSPEYAENLFNNYALFYDQHLRQQLHYTLPNQLLKLLAELGISSSAHSLDLGCGTGLSGQVLRDVSQRLDGVDIAAKMIAQAREKGIYDQLTESELVSFLHQTPEQYNLIVALDVLPYLGDLQPLFAAVSDRLLKDGWFIFSTEISETSSWELQENARFRHHSDYLRGLANRYGFSVISQEVVIARRQEGNAVPEYLIALQRLP